MRYGPSDDLFPSVLSLLAPFGAGHAQLAVGGGDGQRDALVGGHGAGAQVSRLLVRPKGPGHKEHAF